MPFGRRPYDPDLTDVRLQVRLTASPTLSLSNPDATLDATLSVCIIKTKYSGEPITFATDDSAFEVDVSGYRLPFLRIQALDSNSQPTEKMISLNSSFRCGRSVWDTSSPNIRDHGFEFMTIPGDGREVTVTYQCSWERIFEYEARIGTRWWSLGDVEGDLKDKKFHYGAHYEEPPDEILHDENWVLGWLEKMRAHYSRLTDQLESQVLLVTAEQMRYTLDKADRDAVWEPNWKEVVDFDLEELPTALCRGVHHFIEWTYLLDLDRELFTINNWISFDLWNIPRDRWTQAFGVDDEEKRTFSLELCPQASFGIQPPSYFGTAKGEEQMCLATYRQSSVTQVEDIRATKSNHSLSLQQLFALLVFVGLPSSNFLEYIPGLAHDSFAFREVAFAILSLAVGNFHFDRPDGFSGSYTRGRSPGYLVSLGETGEPKLMPLFGSGCHIQDQEPGSAPAPALYWLEDILISLVTDTVLHTNADAAIGKAVAYGLKSGKPDFDIVLFSIQHAVLLEFRTHSDNKTTIRRSGLIAVCHIMKQKVECPCSVTERSDNCECSPLDLIQYNQAGFITLMDFCEAAISRNLSAFGGGCFPVEIYAEIIKHCDIETQKACKMVSTHFRKLCHEHFPFSNGLTAFHLTTSARQPGPRWFVAGTILAVAQAQSGVDTATLASTDASASDLYYFYSTDTPAPSGSNAWATASFPTTIFITSSGTTTLTVTVPRTTAETSDSASSLVPADSSSSVIVSSSFTTLKRYPYLNLKPRLSPDFIPIPQHYCYQQQQLHRPPERHPHSTTQPHQQLGISNLFQRLRPAL
ncbi:hypothetical protein DV735_g3434, partial [Chaetothyriales sp. CBS 134920]